MAHEHAAHLRRREETLPKLIVPYLFREHSQVLLRSGERCARLAGLPTPLMEPADPTLDLPQFARQSDLLGESFGFVQLAYRSFQLAFPLAQDRQGAKVGHPIPLVNLGALGETVRLFPGGFFVSSPQKRLDLVVEVDAEERVEEHADLTRPPGMGVGVLPVLGEGGYYGQSGVEKCPVPSPQGLLVGRASLLQIQQRLLNLSEAVEVDRQQNRILHLAGQLGSPSGELQRLLVLAGFPNP